MWPSALRTAILHLCNTKAQGLWKGSKPRNACLHWSGFLRTLGDPGIRDQPQSHAHKVTQSKHVGDLQ